MSLCAILAPKFPLVCGAFLHNQAVSLLSMPPSPLMADGNDADDVRKLQAFGCIFEILAGDLLHSVKDGSGQGLQSRVAVGEVDVDRLITAQLEEIVERILAWTPPGQSGLQLQRLMCLQNCSPVLKTGPADLLRRVFANLFSHDCPSVQSCAHSGAVSLTALSEKASTVIAHLSHACGESAVADPSLLGDIVTQVHSPLTSPVPCTADSVTRRQIDEVIDAVDHVSSTLIRTFIAKRTIIIDRLSIRHPSFQPSPCSLSLRSKYAY